MYCFLVAVQSRKRSASTASDHASSYTSTLGGDPTGSGVHPLWVRGQTTADVYLLVVRNVACAGQVACTEGAVPGR